MSARNTPTSSRRALLRGLASTAFAPVLGGAALGALQGCSKRGLRFSGIPDGDKRALKEGYEAVAAVLSDALGVSVEYVHVPDYTAAVTSLANGTIDFAWLGGVTTVQAEQRTPGGIDFIAARAQDLQFKSYLIAQAAVAQQLVGTHGSDRTPSTLAALAELAPKLKGRSFSFGSKSSTSGHIMPRAFFVHPQVGIDPETHFDPAPGYQLKGGHAATLRAVASGAVDLGVVNFAAWESADPELQSAAPVIYTTPSYVDYCMVARSSVSAPLRSALRTTLVSLDPSDPAHASVLTAFSAERFVQVDPAQWDGIRTVLADLDARGELS